MMLLLIDGPICFNVRWLLVPFRRDLICANQFSIKSELMYPGETRTLISHTTVAKCMKPYMHASMCSRVSLVI